MKKVHLYDFIINSHNILLDKSLNPKVCDFGFTTPLPIDIGSTQLMTVRGTISLAGTRGYLAPKFNDGKRGVKTDVYIVSVKKLTSDICYYYGINYFCLHDS